MSTLRSARSSLAAALVVSCGFAIPAVAQCHHSVDAMPLFARRHRGLVASGAALLAILLAASIAISSFGFRAARESARRFEAEQVALAERDTACRQAYIASVSGGLSSLQFDEGIQARRRLATAPEELRNFEWDLTSALLERGERIIKAHDDIIFGFAATPDGSRVASATRYGTVAVRDVEAGAQILHMEGRHGGGGAGAAIHAVALTDDGHHLFVGDSRSLLCGGHDRTLHLYDTRPRAEQLARRDRALAALAAATALVDQGKLHDGEPGGLTDGVGTGEMEADIERWVRNLRLMRAAASDKS